eukprot:TRINITY_DN1183_c0_g1_i6.p2 TRINITY_DN1183_c0_g1~~TRINITY_DN1183_c0_g1_i6.p2  ORF type:complete len:189 (-),score=3.29 TRINITY_DN1183_c0_g1_i6:1015-1581(-)
MTKKKLMVAWFNSFATYVPECMIKAIFKVLYGHEPYSNSIVGFKEIRILGPFYEYQNQNHNSSIGQLPLPRQGVKKEITKYEEFVQQMEFLQKLCNKPHIILNLRKNITAQAYSGMYSHQTNKQRLLQHFSKIGEWFTTYHDENPNNTFLVYMEDMISKPTSDILANKLQQFLGVPYDEQFSFVKYRV